MAESYGGSYGAADGGSRVASNVIAKNPLLTRPTVAGLRYFGQNQVSKVSMDQPLAKKIGQFPSPQHGAGMNFHDFNTNPNFQGAQNVAGVTGALLYGSQFKKVTGATALISGSLGSIVASAFSNILSLSLPDSLKSQLPGLTTITSALSSISPLSPTTSLTSVFRLFGAMSFSPSDPTSALISAAVSSAVFGALTGAAPSSLAATATSLLSTTQGFTGSLNSISPASAMSSFGGGTALLQNSIDQALNQAIPGVSLVVSNTYKSVNNIAALSGASPTESLSFKDHGSMVTYASAAAHDFSTQDKAPFSSDDLSKGFTMSKTVADYINKRNSGAA